MIRFIIVFFSYFLLAFHFLRHGNIIFTIISIGFPFILFFKNKISVILVKIGLIFSIFIWLYTFFNLWGIYSKFNLSFTKPGFIIFTVVMYTLFSYFILSKYEKK